MPTPIFQPYSPGIGDDLNKRIKGLTNAYIDTTQQLQWLLTHLDEKNVLKAQSVVADWVYAGNIKTNQLIAGETLIDNALIKNLSASKITAGTITASISIYGPTIVGGTIVGGIVVGGTIKTASSSARIELSNNTFITYNSSDLQHGLLLYPGDGSLYMFDNGIATFMLTSLGENVGYSIEPYNLRGLYIGRSSHTVYFRGNVDFSGSIVSGLELGYATQSYVQNVSSNLSTLISNTMSNHIANYHS